MHVKKTNWSFYNRTLPKSNLKSGSAPDMYVEFQRKEENEWSGKLLRQNVRTCELGLNILQKAPS